MSPPSPMPAVLRRVYFDFDWDRRRVWAVDTRPRVVERKLLDWHLDLPFWSTRPPEARFDVVPRDVIRHPSEHPVHTRRMREADLHYPIDVMEHGGRLCILDGIHRLARTALEGRRRVWVHRIPRSMIKHIRRRQVVRV